MISSSIDPAGTAMLGVPGVVLHVLLLVVTLAVFGWVVTRRVALLRKGAPDPRANRWGERLRKLLIVGFLQSRQPRYRVAGILHILVFFGFLVLLLRSMTLLGRGFVSTFDLPGLSGAAGHVYGSIKDWTALVVLTCCIVLAVRRVVFKPARYHDRHATKPHGAEAIVILSLIASLMITDALYEGSELARAGERTIGFPLASIAAGVLGAASPDVLTGVGLAGFWLHNVFLCFFACYLPISKHFHVITALPNVMLAKLPPLGKIKPPRHGNASLDDLEKLGVSQLEDFTWKHLLDAYTCTDCGRCSDACPAYNTGTKLSPRMISIKMRDEAYEVWPAGFKKPVPQEQRKAFVGEIITDEELWSCTTCGACEETCPVMIEYVDKIVDMRRFLVEDGRVPPSMQRALAEIEKKGNPYGKPQKKRGEWVKGPADTEPVVSVAKAGDSAELGYFTDSATAYDPRIQEIGRAFGSVVSGCGRSIATMGADEVDSGHEARRVGEEGLFEMLRETNLEALGERTFDRVVCSDPHALNALRHDYDELETPVVHHSQVLDELIQEGKLTLQALGDDRTVTFHDPCYLGRHNGEYDAPRRVLDAIPGLKRVEMEASRNRSFCCGGGSLYLFHEGESDRRMGEVRVDMAAQAGAQVVVTACPFCLINLEDAIKTTGRSDSMEVLDLAELVKRALSSPKKDAAPQQPDAATGDA